MENGSPKLPNYRAFKLVITLTVAFILTVLWGVFGWKILDDRRLAVRAAETMGAAYARALREHAERTFGEIDSTLSSFIQGNRSLDPSSADPRLLKASLSPLVAASPPIASIVVLDNHGIMVANSYEGNLNRLDVRDREYVIHHRTHPDDDTPHISPPFKSRITGAWRFTISRRLTTPTGEFAGIVAAAVDISYFNRFYSSLGLGDGGRIVMVRNDGRLLLAEPLKDSDLSHDFSKSHLITTHLPRARQGVFHIPKGKALLEPDHRIISYESLERFPVVVMTNQSMETILAPWKERSMKLSGIMAAASIALLLLTVTLLRQVRRIEQARRLALKQQEEIEKASHAWQTTFDSVEDAIWVMDLHRTITRCNRATERIFSRRITEILNRSCCEVAHGGTTPLASCPFSHMLATKQRASMELEIDGRWYKISVDPVFDEKGIITGAVHIVSDITAIREGIRERELLEQQLAQAQKMEAIGHLAGGIAHDFNNILTPILGYAEMAASEIDPSSPVAARIAGILSAAHRARSLTHQLLSFSRKSSTEIESLDLNDVILSFNDILRRTIRENIRIDISLDPEGAPVRGDRSKLEQILLNMTVNAQDAIGDVDGIIRLSTSRVVMEGENALLYPGMIPGAHILFAIEDSGCGMPKEVLEHIFEPFFTTKPTGHGTGLGLATVYGIVRQHNAFIGVDSRTEGGTTFRIYFPVDREGSHSSIPPQTAGHLRPLGEGTILLVEDDRMVRESVDEMLRKVGYTTFPFSDPREALHFASAPDVTIDLLITDMVMPGMNGRELYERMTVHRPDLKVIFISGYPVSPTMRGGSLEDTFSYLQKPFTTEALLERIREIL
ncbi:MAG: hypothetical protein Fur0034_16880 [Desulfuromonadia bacterium]